MLDAGAFWCARCAYCDAGSRRSCTAHRAARLDARGQRDQREILRLDPLPQRVHRLEGERHDHRQGAAGARAARAASAGHAAGRRRARGRGALESSRVLRVGWVWTTTVVAAKSNSLPISCHERKFVASHQKAANFGALGGAVSFPLVHSVRQPGQLCRPHPADARQE